MSFKTLCLTTLLAAAGGDAVGHWAQRNERPLTHAEKTEINALIFYTAHQKGFNETSIRHEVETQIGLSSLDDMTADEFPAVRLYLQQKAQ